MVSYNLPQRISLLLVISSSLFFSSRGFAQRTGATLEAVVQDATGAVIPNAQLELVNSETQASRSGVTDPNGQFSFLAAEPGRYELTVSVPGMNTQRETGILLTTGVTARVVVQMHIQQATESVAASAAIEAVNTTDAAVSGLVNEDQVQALPLNVRSLSSLLKLQPSVAPGDAATTSEGGPNTNVGGFVGGQRARGSGYTVDGGNVMQPSWHQPIWVTTTGGGISLDAIREFRLFSNNKPVDSGGKSGAYIAITTKSGTDQFRGSLFEYFRNTVLNTRSFFDLKRLPYQQNQFGASLGGPAWKQKRIYFFANFESFRSVQPISLNLTVPTPKLIAAIPSGAANGYLKELFEDSYPAPLPGYNPAGLVATANATVDNGNTRNMGLGRLDLSLTHNTDLAIRFMHLDGVSGFGSVTAAGTFGGNVGQVWSGENLLVRATTIFSPNVVNVLHSSVDRAPINFVGQAPPSALTSLGFSTDPLSPSGVPTISVNGSGIAALGPPSWLPNLRFENTYELADTLNWVRGKHNMSFGAQLFAFEDNVVGIGNQRPSTVFQGFGPPFDTSATGLTTGIFLSQTQNQLAAGDRGMRGYRQKEFSLFAHDNYRVTKRLTVDVGLRWVYHTPFTESTDRLNNAYASDAAGKPLPDVPVTVFNVQSIVLAQPGVAGISFAKKQFKDFAPNIGLNWDVTGSGKTVVSSGYSLAYDRQPMYYLQPAAANVPFVTSTTIVSERFGTVAAPGTAAAGKPSLNVWNPSIATPNVQYWNASVQQAIGQRTVAQVSYIGNKGTHLFTDLQLNYGSSYAGIRPNPNYTTISQTGADGTSNYNALALQVRQQSTKNLSIQLVYTYSKAMDVASAANVASADYPLNEFNRCLDYGPSSFDRRQIFTGNVLYKLPFGKSEPMGACSSGLACNLISDWQASTIFSALTGQVYSLSAGRDVNGDGVLNDRAFLIGTSLDPLFNTTGLSETQFLNPAAVNTVVSSTGTISTTRNGFTGPGFVNVDLELRKAIPIKDRLTLTFVAQAFNIANHANFTTPVGTVSSAAFGQLQRTVGNPRVIQFALRLDF